MNYLLVMLSAETNLSPLLPPCYSTNCRRINLLNDTFVHSFAYNHNNNDTLQHIVVVVHDQGRAGNISSIIMLHRQTGRSTEFACCCSPTETHFESDSHSHAYPIGGRFRYRQATRTHTTKADCFCSCCSPKIRLDSVLRARAQD